MYVAQDIVSSSEFGGTLIQVEVEPGYKYLNLLDEKVQKKLEEVGITNEDVYKLNPKVAIADIKEKKPWWVLKAKEGVKFKPFSSRGISLDVLGQAYLVSHGSSFFESSVKKDILERAKKNLPTVIGSPFINILEEEYGASFVKKAIESHFLSLNNVDEIGNWLRYAGVYLNQSEIRHLIHRAASLPISSLKQVVPLLEGIIR